MVDAPSAPVAAILTRAPRSGGKTRLFASLGLPADPALLTALLLDTLDGAAAPGVTRVIAVTPPDASEDVRRIAGDADVMAQPDGDLGDRMGGTMAALFARGAPAVAVIGSDLPHLVPARIVEAFSCLARDPDALVLGPAADGGYYLIAARRVPNVFTGIEWGSAHVCAQTEAAAVKDGFAVYHLPAMTDVDSADDLRRAYATGCGRRTADWVRVHLSGDGLK